MSQSYHAPKITVRSLDENKSKVVVRVGRVGL